VAQHFSGPPVDSGKQKVPDLVSPATSSVFAGDAVPMPVWPS